MKKSTFITVLSIFSGLAPHTLHGKTTLTGDETILDGINNTITITGTATAKKGEHTLVAKKIIYDKQAKSLNAKGNVKYKLSDKLSMKADSLWLYDNDDIQFTNADYTSCNVQNNGASSWLIHADLIERDAKNKVINLKNATLNIYGYPIYYWPYISQPEPQVKEAEGWLTPSGGTKTTLGVFIKNTYYKPINSKSNISISPTLSSKGGQTLQALYRLKDKNTLLKVSTALTQTKAKKNLYYLSLDYQKTIPATGWKSGIKIETTAKDSYTKEYTFLKEKDKGYLKTSIYSEKASQNTYMSISSSQYRDTRIKKSKETNILPEITYESQLYNKSYGSFIKNKTVVRSIQVAGTGKTSTLSNNILVSIPKYTNSGLLITPSFGLRSDAIQYKNKVHTNTPASKEGTTTRILPSASLIASFPLLATKKNEQHLLEPLVGIFISKRNHKNAFLPNFDSTDLDLNESNLFAKNRYTGIDKIDTDKRLAYGVRLKSWLPNNLYAQGFLGQTLTLSTTKTYSDYIGNFRIEKNNFSFTSNFELDSKELKVRKLESSAKFTLNKFNLDLGLTEINPRDNSLLNPLKQIKTQVGYAIDKNWAVQASNTSNYKNNAGVLKQSLSLAYTTDCRCITQKVTYTKDFSVNPTKPEESFYFNIIFKSFGEDTSLRSFPVVPKK